MPSRIRKKGRKQPKARDMGREIIEGIRAIEKGPGKRYTANVPAKNPLLAKETPASYITQMSTKISTKIGAREKAPHTPRPPKRAVLSFPGAPPGDPSADPRNRMIPAGEIKRRGIGAVDRLLEYGPVHVIQGNRPHYVVMEESYYQELREEADEASFERVKKSEADYKAGRFRRITSVKEFMDSLNLDGPDKED